jgi:hypothetical protein
VSASYIALSGSYNTFSGSASTRVTKIENNYATTGSNSFRADQSITGSLVVSSTITAQTLVVQTVTSSIVYSSGSNIFGSALSNTQTFTGSLNLTGSSHSIFGNLGIGTKNPIALLHLSSSSSTAAYIHSTGTANYASLNLTNNTTGYGYDIGFGGSTSIAPNCFYIYGGATASVKLAVASNGNIGIGTVIPSASLEVSGKVYVGGNTSNTNYQFLVKRGTDRNMGIGLQGTDLSIEFVNDIYTANVPTRIYANPLVLLGGNVGIGTNSPNYANLVISNSAVNSGNNSALVIGRATSLPSSAADYGNIFLFSTDGYAADKGGTISFGSQYGSSGGETRMSGIFGGKENATNGDYSGYLSFYTRLSGTEPAERMRITSGGNVGIGTNTPVTYGTRNLDVNGGAGSAYIVARGSNNAGTIELVFDGDGYMGTKSSHNLILRTADVEKMRITTGGSVLLGTSTNTGDIRLQVAASASWISGTFAGTGSTDKVVLGNLAGYTGASIGAHNSALTAWAQLNINPGGGAVYAGTVRLDTLSDQRVKDNIQPISGSLNKILQLNGKKFHLKDEPDDKIRYGFIAQDLEGILDEFVINSSRTFTKDDLVVENVKSIENWASSWAALLVEAIKELKATNDDLQTQINELKAI